MSVIVAGAALLGFLAGPYVRALASGFSPAEEEARRAYQEEQRAYRAEARAAFRGAVRQGRWPGWPPWAEAGVAAACAFAAWRFAGSADLAAWLYAAVAGCALAMIDWRTRRLPDAITLPSYPIVAVLLALAGHLPGGLLGGLALAGAYGVLWFARPDALGFGDVKLAGLAGMLMGSLGLEAWVTGALAGQFLGALYAMALLFTRRATAKTQFPLGPFILLGAVAAALR